MYSVNEESDEQMLFGGKEKEKKEFSRTEGYEPPD